MTIFSDDATLFSEDNSGADTAATANEDTDEPIEFDTTTTTASGDDTISGGAGPDYIEWSDGDFIVSGFSIGDDGFWF